jgi:DNA processing protein
VPFTDDDMAWLVLHLVPGMTRRRFFTLIQQFGTPKKVLKATYEQLVAVPGMDETTARKVIEHERSARLDQELQLIEEHGVGLLCYSDTRYPMNLKNSSLPPPLLYVKGAVHQEDRFAISVVGSRNNTQYGKSVCKDICKRLAEAGFTIVSGMAKGIDGIAHDAALQNSARTIAVLGNGLAHCYPAENRRLMNAIAEHGAVISTYPMETLPNKGNFPERNAVIASLSLGTLIVEASKNSGALITAQCALEENRAVYAVPGDITRRTSQGTNALIQAGAKLVQSGDDILEDLHFILRGLLKEEEMEVRAQVKPETALSVEERYVYSLIQAEPLSFESLLLRYDKAPQTQRVGLLSTILLKLEMQGLIRQLPGKVFTAKV